MPDGGAERERQLRAQAEQIRFAQQEQREQQETAERAESLRLGMAGDAHLEATRTAADEGRALASLHPRQRERLERAIDFIMPRDETVGIVEVLGQLANGEHECTVRMFAALAGREQTVDIGVRFTGGFTSALTAVMALENLGTAIEEAEASDNIMLSRGKPVTWQESQMRVAALQLELVTLRSERSRDVGRRDRSHNTGLHSDSHGGHTPPPPVRPPAGAVDTVPFTNSLDPDTTSRACHRDVIAPACALPFVITRWGEHDAFEALPVLEAAAHLASMPGREGQSAWAWSNSSGKCRQKCAEGMAVSLLGTHDRLDSWLSAAVTKALGLLASERNPKLCLVIREGIQSWKVKASDLVKVFAARPSADYVTPNHISVMDGLLGDADDLDRVIVGIAEAEEEVLKLFWGEAGLADMLPVADHKLQGAFGFKGLATACRKAGIAAAGTLDVLDAALRRVARAASERRSERSKPVPPVCAIVADEVATRVTGTQNRQIVREQSRQFIAEEMRAWRDERGSNLSRTGLSPSGRTSRAGDSPSERTNQGRYGRESSVDRWSAADDGRRSRSRERSTGRSESADRPPSRHGLTASLVSPEARRFQRQEADLPPTPSRARDSMPAHRARFDARSENAGGGFEGKEYEQRRDRDAPPTLRKDDGSRRSREPSRERERSREPSRERGREQSKERDTTRSAPKIEGKATLAGAFRDDCRAKGVSLTCPFLACFGDCTNPACRECQSGAVFDGKQHAVAVKAVKMRCSPAFAASVRWRDVG
jgi:hypothetical protein